MKIPFLSKCFHKDAKPQAENLNYDYHQLSFEELAQKFNTSVTTGLDDKVASEVLSKTGKNVIKQYKKNPILKIAGYFFTGFCPIIW